MPIQGADPTGPIPGPKPREPAASRRGSRVVALVGVTVLVALADLYMTLVYATTIGLHEGNPLARAIMLYNCPWIIVAFRALTIALFALVLISARKHKSAEIAAWTCTIIMGWLLVRWEQYNANTQELSAVLAALDDHGITDFVSISPSGD